MKYGLLVRAERIAAAAQRRRLEEIAAAVRARGLFAEAGSSAVVIRGRALVKRWLGDPLLRFAGRSAA
jgi:hypothetical protein